MYSAAAWEGSRKYVLGGVAGCAARFLHEVAESGQRLASLILFFLSLSLGDRGGVAIKSAQWLTMPHI